MLQSVAIIGPARFGVPLTQAITAPVLGRMEAGGSGTGRQVLICAAIRAVQNALGTVFFVGIITGLDAYAATYDRVVAGIVDLPEGPAAAIWLTAAAVLAWALFASTIQVLVYRRGLARWDRGEVVDRDESLDAVSLESAEPPRSRARQRRFDPRALALAAALAFAGLLAPVSWPVEAAAAGWLLVAWAAAARAGRDVLAGGLALATLLGTGAFGFAVVGGLGVEIALQRGSRALLLVLVATWLRAAAGSDGLREVARRSLRRLRRVPALDEASEDLDELGAAPRLAAAGRELRASLRGVRRRPLALIDAVLGWAREEAYRFEPAPRGAAVALGLRARDLAVVALALAPAGAAFAAA